MGMASDLGWFSYFHRGENEMEFYSVVFVLCGIIHFYIKFYQAYFSSLVLFSYCSFPILLK